MKTVLISALVLCALVASPANCMSRWFTSAYTDLKYTLYRYGHCISGLQPIASARFNETEYLVNQMRVFLDQGNFDNEQLANVSSLMDTICRTSAEPSYPISMHVDINRFNSSSNPAAKETRCRAIEDAMESMYHVFKRAALNRSEPLDFASIQFYANETDRSTAYNLSDLINTSWITSEVVLEHVCSITNATKEYVKARSSSLKPEAREDPGVLRTLIDQLLDSVLGLQKRLYWESANRWESLQLHVSSGLTSVRNGVGHGLGRTANLLLWRRPEKTNATANHHHPTTMANVTDGHWTNLTGTVSNARANARNSTARPLNNQEGAQSSSPLASTTATTTTATTTTTTTTPQPLRMVSNRTSTATSTTIVV